MKKGNVILILTLFVVQISGQIDECTIGVANGTATPDGRPMVWKTRDYESKPDNEVKYFTNYDIKFISVINAGETGSSWMGVNEHGFAIVNSNSTDLPDGSSSGLSNGPFMLQALGLCKTIAEFEQLLDETNVTGRRTNANFGVIDSTGAAAIFETANLEYWKFDAANTLNGYVLRTNFAVNGTGSSGSERLARSVKIIGDLYAGDTLTYKNILRYQMRDFSNITSTPYPIPYNGSIGGMPQGYIETNYSICRNSSVSAAIIHGVKDDEPAGLSTMWTILGQPATSVALPFWPMVYPPNEADGLFTAPLCDVSREIKSILYDQADSRFINTYGLNNGNGGGLWSKTFPYENMVFQNTEDLLNEWRDDELLDIQDMKNTEDSMSLNAYNFMLSALDYLKYSDVKIHRTGANAFIYPNPFGAIANISLKTDIRGDLSINVYSVSGELLASKKSVLKSGDRKVDISELTCNLKPGLYIIEVNSIKEALRIVGMKY